MLPQSIVASEGSAFGEEAVQNGSEFGPQGGMNLGYATDPSGVDAAFYNFPSSDMYGRAFSSGFVIPEGAAGFPDQSSSDLPMQLSLPELSNIAKTNGSACFQAPHAEYVMPLAS